MDKEIREIHHDVIPLKDGTHLACRVDIDGIKVLSNLGGLPAAVIILATSLTLCKWLQNPGKLNHG